LGFNFRRISAEKFSDSLARIKINSNLDIIDIKEISSDILKGDDEILSIDFKYKIGYDPEIAKLEFEGTLLISVEKGKSKEILKEWENKKMLEELKMPLFNLIIKKSSIKALQLEEEMNIPFHLPLPTVRKADSDKK
ncbi:MAG: hypothetical protein Q8P15_01735, partial [Nanoarchaeota archaeon]|nr:hypothetical protein [Nanoarchaeota archaeon]